MASRSLRSAAVAAALLVLWGAPAHAQATVPEGPVKIFLKDHEDLPLDAEGADVLLTRTGDLWSLKAAEALLPLGTHQLVHDESGQCLTADTAGGGETAPIGLVDCADAIGWEVVYDDRPSHYDYRFVTTDGYYLGLETNGAVDGARVLAVSVDGATLHSQEWQFTAGTDTPSSPPPSETPSAPVPSESSAAAPPQSMLPQTGVGAGVAAGAGAVALLGGAVLVLWWQRRRALRSVW